MPNPMEPVIGNVEPEIGNATAGSTRKPGGTCNWQRERGLDGSGLTLTNLRTLLVASPRSGNTSEIESANECPIRDGACNWQRKLS